MSDITVKTIFALHKELFVTAGADYVPLPFSTYNEIHSVFHGEPIPAGSRPETAYFGIGRGGHKNATDLASEDLQNPQQHQIADAHLFKPIPLIMRETDDDLSDAEIAKYRMRKVITANGKQYFAYYLMKVDLTTSVPTIRHVDATGGTEVITPYTPTVDQLTLPPVTVVNNEANTSTGIHLNGLIGLTVTLTPNDISEILNCVDIIYNDRRFALITEQALASGIDKEVTSNDGGVPRTYTEVIAACNNYYIDMSIKLVDYQTTGGELTFDLGNSLPWVV